METKCHTINILWIEDNPNSNGLLFRDLQKRFPNENLGTLPDNYLVPAIYFSDPLTDYYKYFTLNILQHPEEIKDYISLCLEIEDTKGALALGKVPTVIPEIIPFDYKLFENIKINQDKGNVRYSSQTKKLREFYNPNIKILKFYSDSFSDYQGSLENEKYNEIDFLEKINRSNSTEGSELWLEKDEDELKDDEMGLYSGVILTKQFRNHICVGIPVTANKADISLLGAHAKYFEWLNAYDLGTMFTRESKGSKDWKIIITEAVKQLRERIKIQLKSNKIQINISQLIILSESKQLTELKSDNDRIFSFESIYGERSLPLDGLFIDKTIGDEREEAISNWANDLISILLSNLGGNNKIDIYQRAIDGVEELWRSIENGQSILRYQLSYLENKNEKIQLLQKQLKDLERQLQNKNEPPKEYKEIVEEYEKKEAELKSILFKDEEKEEYIRLRIYFETNDSDKNIKIAKSKAVEFRNFKKSNYSRACKRMIIFFSVIKLIKQHEDFMRNSGELFIKTKSFFSSPEASFLLNKPNLSDLRYVLFPVPLNPIVIFAHNPKDDPITRYTKNEEIINYDIPDDLDMSKELSLGELPFIREYARSIGLKKINISSETESINPYYPLWLR